MTVAAIVAGPTDLVVEVVEDEFIEKRCRSTLY
jgi:hypothetical protein